MNIPRKELLKNCKNPIGMEALLKQAESVLRTWQPIWSPFITAPLREEALEIMSPLNNLHWHADGGHPGAERQRLQCIRYEDERPTTAEPAPIEGIRIEGNFLFDRASPNNFRQSLEMIGVPSGGLGDIWIRGDRGAQALCTPEAAKFLNNRTSSVRDVQIRCESVRKEELQLPNQRLTKIFSTVEASKRIDAIASAGFGLSRAKIANQIKEGRLRLNWELIRQANKELRVGDCIQFEGRGTLKIISLDLTKRQRWRVELLRQ